MLRKACSSMGWDGDADAGSESIPRFLKGGEPASPDVVLIGPKRHWKASQS